MYSHYFMKITRYFNYPSHYFIYPLLLCFKVCFSYLLIYSIKPPHPISGTKSISSIHSTLLYSLLLYSQTSNFIYTHTYIYFQNIKLNYKRSFSCYIAVKLNLLYLAIHFIFQGKYQLRKNHTNTPTHPPLGSLSFSQSVTTKLD